MICADFAAGANLDSGKPETLLLRLSLLQVLARSTATSISRRTAAAGFVKIVWAKEAATRLDPAVYESCDPNSCTVTVGSVNSAVRSQILRSSQNIPQARRIRRRQSDGPFAEGCEPALLISIIVTLLSCVLSKPLCATTESFGHRRRP